MADPTPDDPTGTLPWNWVPSSWRPDATPAADAAAPTPEVDTSTAASSAAPSDADAKAAGVTPASKPDEPAKKATPVLSDLQKFAAVSKAVASGDPLAIAGAAGGTTPDLAKLQAVQQLVGGHPGAPAAPPMIGAAPVASAAAGAPPATDPMFSPIPPLVGAVQDPSGAGAPPLPGGPPGPPPPPGVGLPPPGSTASGAGMPDAVTGAAPALAPPPAPPVVPDAISGATPAYPGTGPTVANTPGLTFSMEGGPGAGPLPPTDEYGQPLGKIASLDDAQAKRWAETAAPDELLEQQRLLEVRQRNKAMKDAAEADAKSLASLKQDQADLAKANAASQMKSDRIVADAIAMATKKTDPNRWLSTRTAGQRLRDILLAAAGGLIQARQGPGARNIGMDMVQQEIDRDIDAQKQDIENGKHALGIRQNAVAEEFKRNGNLYEAAEKVRLATYEAALNRMKSEQQNFDPRGTSFLNYGNAIRDLQGKAAEHVEKIRTAAFEEDMKAREAVRKQQETAATIAHQRNEDSVAFGRLGLDRDKQKTENQVWSPQQLAAINPNLPVPPIAMTQKEFGSWLGNQKTGSEMGQQTQQEIDRQNDRVRQFSIGTVTPRLATDKEGKPVLGDNGLPQLQHGPLLNADGKPWLVSDTGEHKALSDKLLAASEVSDMINEILSIRNKVGGESGVFNSDEYQRLKVLQNRLTILQKSGTQGMSSDEDMQKLVAAAGAADVTSFRDKSAGLKEALQRTETEFNKAMRIGNYTGPSIKFPNPYGAPEAGETAQDIRDEDLFKKPAGGNEAAAFKNDFLAEYRRRTADLSPDERRAFEDHPLTEDEVSNARFSLAPNAGGQHWVEDINEPDNNRVHTNLSLSPQQRAILNDVASKFDPNATVAQQSRIAELEAAARGSDKAGEDARTLLGKLATDGHTKRLRELAKAALQTAATNSIPDSESAPEPGGATPAYETLPPPVPAAPPKKRGR